MTLKEVDIYSDWWARPNPGTGGYWVILSYKWIKKEFYKWFKITTNNRMELMGVITGLEKLKTKSIVNIHTDSQYTINWIEKWWAKKWKENNWLKSNKTKAVNSDLWEKLLNLIEKHEVKFHWIKWHNGHIENERCDELATLAIETLELADDEGFKYEEKQMELGQTHRSAPTNNVEVNLCVHPITRQDLIKKVLNENVDKNIKITAEWQACRKCWTKVEKRIPKKTNTKNKSYYYKFYLACPWCSTNYFVDEAKVLVK